MFEAAEIDHKVSKEKFKEAEMELHHRVLILQQRLRQSPKSLIIIVSGVEGAGEGEVLDRLNRWFDTRDVETHAFFDETDEEIQRPRYWRFWRCLPARGKVGIMFGSWYTNPIVDLALKRSDLADMDQELNRINTLEQMLSNDDTIILKFWFHLSKEEQIRRLESEAEIKKLKKSPLLKDFSKSYDAFLTVSERAIRVTDTGHAPWHIIGAIDMKYRDLAMGSILVYTLEDALEDSEEPAKNTTSTTKESDDDIVASILNGEASHATVLDTVDLTQQLDDKEFDERLIELRERLHGLAWDMLKLRRNMVMVFEGWDGAGKGSAIRRVTAAIDARLYRVIPIAAPSDEELAHHYLWRFWRQIPRGGHITIYDRSWYGRVLVERVEGFATKQQWLRSYKEINDFEEHLTNHGTVVCKFWVHIDQEEQLRRFKARETDLRKQHKITDEDWRNREKWHKYELAVNDMVTHTSTANTPWTLVAGNDKKFARVQILETICERLQAVVDAGKDREPSKSD